MSDEEATGTAVESADAIGSHFTRNPGREHVADEPAVVNDPGEEPAIDAGGDAPEVEEDAPDQPQEGQYVTVDQFQGFMREFKEQFDQGLAGLRETVSAQSAQDNQADLNPISQPQATAPQPELTDEQFDKMLQNKESFLEWHKAELSKFEEKVLLNTVGRTADQLNLQKTLDLAEKEFYRSNPHFNRQVHGPVAAAIASDIVRSNPKIQIPELYKKTAEALNAAIGKANGNKGTAQRPGLAPAPKDRGGAPPPPNEQQKLLDAHFGIR